MITIKRWRAPAGCAALVLALAVPAALGARQAQRERTYARTPADMVPYGSVEPYRWFYRSPPEYRGAGRLQEQATEVETVRIGLLAPLEGTADDARGNALLRGAQLALEQANAQGGYRGLPFQLVARNDDMAWGSSSNTLVSLAYEDRVWAVIGSLDSNSTHVALRVALKAEIPIVNVGASDPTITETGIPWIVRCSPDDRQTGYRLARRIFIEETLTRVAVLRSSDRYGRFGVREFRDAARRLRHPLALEILFEPGETDFRAPLERIRSAQVDAVVLWANGEAGGRIVAQMRKLSMTQRVFGTDRLVSAAFLTAAGEAAEGVEAAAWMDPQRQDARWLEFRDAFVERFGLVPDTIATYGYDAGRLTVDAVREAGLNRARIRDALTGRTTYEGVGGRFVFDTNSSNVTEPVLARVVDGRFVALTEAKPPMAAVAPTGQYLRLGLLAPESPAGEALAAGAREAVAEANRSGGIRGQSVRLDRVAPAEAWRDAASLIARMAGDEHLVALLGATDRATAHLAAQVATRLRIPFVAAAADGSLTGAMDPWIFRGIPSDTAQAAALLRRSFANPRGKHVLLVTPTGRDGEERLAALRRACRALGVQVAEVLTEMPARTLPPHDAILLWLDPAPALEFIQRLDIASSQWENGRRSRAGASRAADLLVLGSHRLASPRFLDGARDLVARILIALPASAATTPDRQWARFGERQPYEQLGYDLIRTLVAAGRRSGINAGAIRDGLRDLSGAAGIALRFDVRGNRLGVVPSAILVGRGRSAMNPARNLRPKANSELGES